MKKDLRTLIAELIIEAKEKGTRHEDVLSFIREHQHVPEFKKLATGVLVVLELKKEDTSFPLST